MKTIAFFSNKEGPAKASLVYHLAWMFNDIGHRVLAVDLDPQCNLTGFFLEDSEIESIWYHSDDPHTILGTVNDSDESHPPKPIFIDKELHFIAGDVRLSKIEDRLSKAWVDCASDDPHIAADGMHNMGRFHRVIAEAAQQDKKGLTLIDVGAGISAVNRAALIAADFVVIPLETDLFSCQGLRNIGPAMRDWQSYWANQRKRNATTDPLIPSGRMVPLGYVLLATPFREHRQVESYLTWTERSPAAYATDVMNNEVQGTIGNDASNQLASLKSFTSLLPMAQDARKPMFHLTAADGAIGGHARAVQDCRWQFEALANRILGAIAE